MNIVSFYTLVAFEILLLIFIALVMWNVVHGIFTVPWVRTTNKISKAMFTLAKLKPGERVVDFGCGDASMLVVAAKHFQATGNGIENFRPLVHIARLHSRLCGVSDKINIHHGNILNLDKYPEADVIAMYMFTEVNKRLEPILIKKYPKGTRVVSRTFKFPTLSLIKKERVGSQDIYLYEI